MYVQFLCPNLLTDAAGNQSPCGRQLRAPRDKAGRLAKCPQCGSKVKVPAASDPAFGIDAGPAIATDAVGHDHDDLQLQVRQDDFDDPVLDGAARPGAIETEPRMRSSSASSANPRTKNFLPLDQTNRCRKCGKATNARGYCDSCNYSSAPRAPAAGTQIDHIKIKTTGMQLWISDVVSEGVPPGILALILHVLFAALIVVLSGIVYTNTQGMMCVTLAAIITAGAFFYVATVWKIRQFRHDPYATLAWFQRPFWDGVLWYCRKNGWADPKHPNRVIIDKRHSLLTDQELDKVKDLKHAAVLDLEGTRVSDGAFRFFYRMDNLQCVVLKDTEVSHEAVFRLQQTRPKLWIWY